MLVIGEVLVTEDVTSERFACQLSACKGACCWEGDFGAPLEADELSRIAEAYPTVAPLLTPAGRAAIEAEGPYYEAPDGRGPAVTLRPDGGCAFLTREPDGSARCGLEKAWRAGSIDWPKPISCHLYPIRVQPLAGAGFEALNYDRWDICSAACAKGAEQNIRVFEFAKTALVRKYGQDWYDELLAAVAHTEEG